MLTVECSNHNYSLTTSFVFVSYRKAALQNSEIRVEIEKEWGKESKISDTLKKLSMKLDESIFKPQNIWNANRNLKFLVMRYLTSTQTLMKHLIESFIWYVNYKKKKSSDELKFLFFTSNCI